MPGQAILVSRSSESWRSAVVVVCAPFVLRFLWQMNDVCFKQMEDMLTLQGVTTAERLGFNPLTESSKNLQAFASGVLPFLLRNNKDLPTNWTFRFPSLRLHPLQTQMIRLCLKTRYKHKRALTRANSDWPFSFFARMCCGRFVEPRNVHCACASDRALRAVVAAVALG